MTTEYSEVNLNDRDDFSNLTPVEFAQARAFRDHEHRVVASFPDALVREPWLTCQEWARRNPFRPGMS